jgi:hypothetical protein
MYKRPPQAGRELEDLQDEMIELRVRAVVLSEKVDPDAVEVEQVRLRLSEVERILALRSRTPYY